MFVVKNLPETETNHGVNEINKAFNEKAYVMPVIPINENPLTYESMSQTGIGRRHDARIYDLEPADYTVIICAFPQQV